MFDCLTKLNPTTKLLYPVHEQATTNTASNFPSTILYFGKLNPYLAAQHSVHSQILKIILKTRLFLDLHLYVISICEVVTPVQFMVWTKSPQTLQPPWIICANVRSHGEKKKKRFPMLRWNFMCFNFCTFALISPFSGLAPGCPCLFCSGESTNGPSIHVCLIRTEMSEGPS